MNLHEYQAKQVLAGFGSAGADGGRGALGRARRGHGPRSSAATGGWSRPRCTPAAGARPGACAWPSSLDEVESIAGELIGKRLVTKQTTADGQPIGTVLVESTTGIDREFYLSMLVDRARRRVAIMASAAGGMDIEEVAASDPSKIITEFVDPAAGLQPIRSGASASRSVSTPPR